MSALVTHQHRLNASDHFSTVRSEDDFLEQMSMASVFAVFGLLGPQTTVNRKYELFMPAIEPKNKVKC